MSRSPFQNQLVRLLGTPVPQRRARFLAFFFGTNPKSVVSIRHRFEGEEVF